MNTTPFIKPEVTVEGAASFLGGHLPGVVSDVRPLAEGEISRVFFYTYAGREYVLRFAMSSDGFERDRYAFEHVASDAVPIPRIVAIGPVGEIFFAISEESPGVTLGALPAAELNVVLPDLARIIHERPFRVANRCQRG